MDASDGADGADAAVASRPAMLQATECESSAADSATEPARACMNPVCDMSSSSPRLFRAMRARDMLPFARYRPPYRRRDLHVLQAFAVHAYQHSQPHSSCYCYPHRIPETHHQALEHAPHPPPAPLLSSTLDPLPPSLPHSRFSAHSNASTTTRHCSDWSTSSRPYRLRHRPYSLIQDLGLQGDVPPWTDLPDALSMASSIMAISTLLHPHQMTLLRFHHSAGQRHPPHRFYFALRPVNQ